MSQKALIKPSSPKDNDIRDLFINYWQELKSHPGCADLGMGMPPLSMFESILHTSVESLIELGQGKWRVEYQHQAGDPFLREAIARFESNQIGSRYTSDNVMVTSGALRAFSLVLDCLVEEKTKIIEIVPTYPLCAGQSRKVVGNKSIITVVPKDTRTFQFTYEEVAPHIKPSTIIYLTNPNNPTGLYVPDDVLSRIVRDCEQVGAYLVIDQASDISLLESSKDSAYLNNPHVIRIRSLAKNYLLAGIRIGYIIAHPKLIKLFSESFAFSDGNAPCIANDVITKYLDDPQILPSIANVVQHKVDLALSKLEECKSISNIIKPEGCFYIFFQVEYPEDSWHLFKNLVMKGVNVLPGCLFDVHSSPWLRLCCGREDFTLTEHIGKLNHALDSL